MKISVITPTLIAVLGVEQVVQSVLDQRFENFEHIIVDSGSKGGTLEKLKHFPHVKVIAAPQLNQVNVMNLGFTHSVGEIIVYLTADDYFLDAPFEAVLPEFQLGAKFVVGNVLVKSSRGHFELWNYD